MSESKYRVITLPGYTPYRKGLALQQAAFHAVSKGEFDGVVFILEHAPVYTFGASGGEENLLLPKEQLESEGIDLVPIRRGGNITYHGPGQIVAYPILDLSKLQKDLHWYVGNLEEAVIKTLGEYDLQGGRKAAYRGAWLEDEKIAAVGVQFKRWISLHGLAFNIEVDKSAFGRMNPCGITEFGICSLADFVNQPSIAKIKEQLINNLAEVYHIDLIPGENPWEDVAEVEVIDV